MIWKFRGGNPIWNRSKRIKNLKVLACALRQGFSASPADHAHGQQVHPPFPHFLFAKGSR
jgi:hypothetical protein